MSLRCDEFRVSAIERALDLLEMLALSNVGVTLTEASRKLEMPLSTAHDILYTLAARGYILRDIDGHHFSLGPQAFEFANLPLKEGKLRLVCFPHTERLARKLGMVAFTGYEGAGRP
jgi:IclR family acetate operon transcriptional repressor